VHALSSRKRWLSLLGTTRCTTGGGWSSEKPMSPGRQQAISNGQSSSNPIFRTHTLNWFPCMAGKDSLTSPSNTQRSSFGSLRTGIKVPVFYCGPSPITKRVTTRKPAPILRRRVVEGSSELVNPRELSLVRPALGEQRSRWILSDRLVQINLHGVKRTRTSKIGGRTVTLTLVEHTKTV
jgi:hypothetical protein